MRKEHTPASRFSLRKGKTKGLPDPCALAVRGLMIFQSARLVMMLAFMLVSLACLLVLLILSIAPHVESTNPCTQCTNVYPVGVTTSGSTYLVAPTTGYDGGTTPVTCTTWRSLAAGNYMLTNMCYQTANGQMDTWKTDNVCQYSCYAAGVGYTGDNCCPDSKFCPLPSECTTTGGCPSYAPTPFCCGTTLNKHVAWVGTTPLADVNANAPSLPSTGVYSIIETNGATIGSSEACCARCRSRGLERCCGWAYRAAGSGQGNPAICKSFIRTSTTFGCELVSGEENSLWGGGSGGEVHGGLSLPYFMSATTSISPSPSPPPPSPSPPPHFTVIFGVCTIDPNANNCIRSPNFPANYNNSQTCSITPTSLAIGNRMTATSFSTEAGYDFLRMYNTAGTQVDFSGTSMTNGPSNFVLGSGSITWTSNQAVFYGGWRVCVLYWPPPSPSPPPPLPPPPPPPVTPLPMSTELSALKLLLLPPSPSPA